MPQTATTKKPRKLKDWVAKRDDCRPAEVSVIGIAYAGRKPGERMLVSSPADVHAQLRKIKKGRSMTPVEFREQLAAAGGADFACPLTAGIFLRIASEAAWQELQNGVALEKVAPFWRVVDASQPIAKKLACGVDFIRTRRRAEGLAE
jgi:hypothetical protein